MMTRERMVADGNRLFKYRGQIPVLLLVAGLATWYFNTPPISQVQHPELQITYELGCLVISLFGLVIRIVTIGYAAKNTSGRNTETQVADSLNTTGIYSVVRHPLYIGNFFMWMGIALYVQSLAFLLCFILFYILYYERIIMAEEDYLSRKFGDVYRKWSETTPAIIPSFRQFIPPANVFSLKTVLGREYTGFFLVFFTLYLFEWTGYLAGTHRVECYWHYLTAFAAIAAITLRTLRKNTKLLKEEN